MREGFMMDSWIAMLFFRICSRYKITAEKDRVLLSRELTRRKKTKYIRDIAPVIAGKKVLQIVAKPSHNPGPEHFCPECREEKL